MRLQSMIICGQNFQQESNWSIQLLNCLSVCRYIFNGFFVWSVIKNSVYSKISQTIEHVQGFTLLTHSRSLTVIAVLVLVCVTVFQTVYMKIEKFWIRILNNNKSIFFNSSVKLFWPTLYLYGYRVFHNIFNRYFVCNTMCDSKDPRMGVSVGGKFHESLSDISSS